MYILENSRTSLFIVIFLVLFLVPFFCPDLNKGKLFLRIVSYRDFYVPHSRPSVNAWYCTIPISSAVLIAFTTFSGIMMVVCKVTKSELSSENGFPISSIALTRLFVLEKTTISVSLVSAHDEDHYWLLFFVHFTSYSVRILPISGPETIQRFKTASFSLIPMIPASPLAMAFCCSCI